MIPIEFEHSNKNYTKPDSMTDEECQDLPVWEGNYQNGQHVIISCWQLSKEDIEEIQRTGVVWLHVVGYQQPPVCVEATNPFIPFDKN